MRSCAAPLTNNRLERTRFAHLPAPHIVAADIAPHVEDDVGIQRLGLRMRRTAETGQRRHEHGVHASETAHDRASEQRRSCGGSNKRAPVTSGSAGPPNMLHVMSTFRRSVNRTIPGTRLESNAIIRSAGFAKLALVKINDTPSPLGSLSENFRPIGREG
jgi:hypothetical protein